MSVDVITLIAKERDRLLQRIITPHLPRWPDQKEGVLFRFDVGLQLVFVNGLLVGAVKEKSFSRPTQFKEISTEIANAFEYWRIEAEVKQDANV